jgi:hypothetical protein
MPNHRPVEAFIEKHTTRLRPANNKSGRYIVKCNFCDYEGEHRELRIHKHLKTCPNAPDNVKILAITAIMDKAKISVMDKSSTSDASEAGSSSGPSAIELSSGILKKRKMNTLDSYLATPMSDADLHKANLLLLRYDWNYSL